MNYDDMLSVKRLRVNEVIQGAELIFLICDATGIDEKHPMPDFRHP